MVAMCVQWRQTGSLLLPHNTLETLKPLMKPKALVARGGLDCTKDVLALSTRIGTKIETEGLNQAVRSLR